MKASQNTHECGYRHSRLLPSSLCIICRESAPDTLTTLCFKFIIRNLYTVCDTRKKPYHLKDGVVLPPEISNKLLEISQLTGKVDNEFLGIFENLNATRLTKACLRNADISDSCLNKLLKHKLTELELTLCPSLTKFSLQLMNEFGDDLVSLSLKENAKMVPSEYFELKLAQLKRLTFHDFNPDSTSLFTGLLRNLTMLSYLDLSECSNLGNMEFLWYMPHLTSLILYNVQNLQLAFPSICKVKTLKHLDVSQSQAYDQFCGVYKDEYTIFKTIIESLPNLTSLDISGTNLAGRGVAEADEMHEPSNEMSDIPGLSSRINNPLRFLGLYGTRYSACRRHHIPAVFISGEANEEQILVAATAYIDRAEILQRVLNDLYYIFRFETSKYIGHALNVILRAMERHPNEKHIQISGSATLFYIVKCKCSFDVRVKQHIVSTLLNGMFIHKDDETMMRNGCLTICQLKIPMDVLFEYERLVQVLLHSATEMEQDSFVQRIGIYLLNSLASQVDGQLKQRLGDLGVITKMLKVIDERLLRAVCDDVLEVAWSTMWNVTDETPLNCKRFLDSNGMELFIGCLQNFPNRDELLRNMMGLLGNVAEVKALRPRFRTVHLINIFTSLLDSKSDGIEVSYNAAGVLAHIMSDGPEAWTITEPDRDEVLTRIRTAIRRWKINSERNLNYRSFEPILGLVRAYHTPECQLWAVWALANLTTVYGYKYCPLVEQENGIELLEEVAQNEQTHECVKELADIVITNCKFLRSMDISTDDAQLDG